jgi:hypothetical protein
MAFLARVLTQKLAQATTAPPVSLTMPPTKLRENLVAGRETRAALAEKVDQVQLQPAAFGRLMLSTPLVPLIMRRQVGNLLPSLQSSSRLWPDLGPPLSAPAGFSQWLKGVINLRSWPGGQI